MTLLDKMLGNAVQIDVNEAQNELDQILIEKEIIHLAYKVVRDFMVFTSKRLILVDKQGLTGKKIEYHSIPYKSITHYSVESGGTFDRDADLKIWISGIKEPIEKKFKKGGNVVFSIQGALAHYV